MRVRVCARGRASPEESCVRCASPGGCFFVLSPTSCPLFVHSLQSLTHLLSHRTTNRHGDFIYRDIKPENMLLDGEGNLKVVDFGFCKPVPKGSKTWTICGTPDYMSPEAIKGRGYDRTCDWVCGRMCVWVVCASVRACVYVVVFFLAISGFCKSAPKGSKTWTICGTPDYMSPEVIKGRGYGRTCDWVCFCVCGWVGGWVGVVGVWLRQASGQHPPFAVYHLTRVLMLGERQL